MKKLLLALFCALTLQATSLTGTINAPDGTGANGTLVWSLAQQGALSATGGCGGPIEILPTVQVRIKVVNGAMVAPPNIYGNDCILPQNTFYNILFVDNNGNNVFTDRWQIGGSTVDIGTIVSVVITGTTQTLGSNGVVLATPVGNQAIAQPAGTALSVNALAITSSFTAPGGFACSAASGECLFSAVSSFASGLGTGATSNSTIYIGAGGSLYLRSQGSTAFCAGVADGWAGIRTDTKALVVCIGGLAYSIALNLGQ